MPGVALTRSVGVGVVGLTDSEYIDIYSSTVVSPLFYTVNSTVLIQTNDTFDR